MRNVCGSQSGRTTQQKKTALATEGMADGGFTTWMGGSQETVASHGAYPAARAAWRSLDGRRANLDLLSQLDPIDAMEPLSAMDVRAEAYKPALALDALTDGREAQLALMANAD